MMHLWFIYVRKINGVAQKLLSFNEYARDGATVKLRKFYHLLDNKKDDVILINISVSFQHIFHIEKKLNILNKHNKINIRKEHFISYSNVQ